MENKCQSCGMPLREDILGNNKDGSLNHEYCKHCFTEGKFVLDVPMDKYVEHMVELSTKMNMSETVARQMCMKVLPTLKRWQ